MFLKFVIFGCLVALATASFPYPRLGFRFNERKHGRISRIVGGEDAAEHEFPHQVSLQVNLPEETHFCGGAIIDNSWILTAAHCPAAIPLYMSIYVKAGKHLVDVEEETEQNVKVEKFYIHEQYGFGVGPYDIALLKLEKPLVFNDFVKPIAIPEKESQVDGDVVVSGWGSIDPYGEFFPQTLQKATLTIIDVKTCKSSIEGITEKLAPVTEKNVCTKSMTVGVSACSGDSGGPLIKIQGNDHKELVGVVSWGIMPCGTEGAAAVFTRVSAYNDWIQEIMAKNAGTK